MQEFNNGDIVSFMGNKCHYLCRHPNHADKHILLKCGSGANDTLVADGDDITKPVGYAVLGIRNGHFVVGDTKDNERYAMNSFRKHFPNAIDVKELTTEDY